MTKRMKFQRLEFILTASVLLLVIFSRISTIHGFMDLEPIDYWPTNEWRISKPEDQGMDSKILKNILLYIENPSVKMDGILIVRNGYIVMEEYYSGWSKDITHPIFSCTKSITSALVGIAIQQGYFNTSDYILDFFTNKEIRNVDEKKLKMTVKDLLQMKSGIDWDEWTVSYDNPNNLFRLMMNSDDWVKFILDRPMAADPGTTFVYNSGVSHLLSAIIQVTTNMTTLEFAQLNLFNKLNMEIGSWYSSPDNVVCGGAFLQLTPQDMAKFGYLFLNNGTWEDEQVFSLDWFEESIHDYYSIDSLLEPRYYGYQWWILPNKYNYFAFVASGYQGQWISIIPELALVIIFTASSYDPLPYHALTNSYIIPSIITESPATATEKSSGYEFVETFLGMTFATLVVLKRINVKRKSQMIS